MNPDRPDHLAQDPRRPLSATPWSVSLLYVFCIFLQVYFARRTFWLLLPYDSARLIYDSFTAWALELLVRLALLALPSLLIVAVHRRSQWGRWLGMLAIGTLVVPVFIDDSVAQASAVYAYVIWPALVILWGYRFGFSARSKAYFAPPRAPDGP